MLLSWIGGAYMKYPMKLKTERPNFNYIVRMNSGMDYYLYVDFDSAIRKAMSLSHGSQISLVYEIFFNTSTREFFGQNTFTIYDGVIDYEKHAMPELHVEFYVNAGDWLNPDVNLLKCPYCHGKPNMCTKTSNHIINGYVVRCTDGCFAQTDIYKTQNEAISAWLDSRINR